MGMRGSRSIRAQGAAVPWMGVLIRPTRVLLPTGTPVVAMPLMGGVIRSMAALLRTPVLSLSTRGPLRAPK